MLPPLLRIMINEPRLLSEHVGAYSNLVAREAHLWQASLKRRFIFKLIATSSLFFALLFAGIALMIWGATDHLHWTLIVVPLVPFGIFIATALMGAGDDDDTAVKPFETIKAQICTDVSLFKEQFKNG